MEQIQVSMATAFMREQELLRAAKTWLEPRFSEIRALSFGCSIGDELASIKTLMPDAEIHGADINRLALEVAERTTGAFAQVFLSDEAEIARRGPFQLVCAFSSLCINPSPPDLPERYPFARFERVVELFSEVLVPGGVLALFNTSYLFQHASAYGRFDVLRPDHVMRNGWVDVYAPDGARLLRAKPTPASYAQVLESADGIEDDWHLIDSLFVRRDDATATGREILPLTLYDPLPDQPSSQVAEWERSDLDSLAPEDHEGYVDFRHTYRIFRTEAGASLLERDVRRDSVLGGPPITVGPIGRHPLG